MWSNKVQLHCHIWLGTIFQKSSKRHSFKFRLFCSNVDESHNKISRRGQMDLHVRFWDIKNKCVATWYFDPKFLGKAAAQDIYKKFNECISELDENKLLQVSSDGANVNLVFLDLLNEHGPDNELSR